jgi:hemerythrin-like domain-containing protein
MTTQTNDKASRTSSKQTETPGKGALIGAAVAGVAVGLIANVGRKLAVQSPTALAPDWAEGLAGEHRATLAIFDLLEATSDKQTTRRAMLLMQLKHALAKHALQEENVIYPALRDAGDKEAADRLNSDHGYVKQYLYELSKMPNSSPEFLTTLGKFRSDIERHMQEEENDLFPSLKSKLSDEKNKELAAMMNKEGFKLA